MLRRTMMQKRNGFTLIELLVVISIIALLIAILLPALRSARNNAITIQCASGIRQVAMGMHMYHTDEGYFMPITVPSVQSSTGAEYWWPAVIDYYVPTRPDAQKIRIARDSILYCPAVTEPGTLVATRVSYGYNRRGVGGDSKVYSDYSRLLKEIPRPTETLMLVDIDALTQSGDGWFEAYNASGFFFTRHMEGTVANVAYADGHGKSVPDEAIRAPGGTFTNEAPWFSDNTNY